MFSKKKKNATNPVSQQISDRAAEGISEVLYKIQCMWTGWMSRQEHKLSIKCKAIVLAISFLTITAFCGVLMLGYFKEDQSLAFARVTIKVPDMGSKQTLPVHNRLPVAAYQRIHRFRAYLDSLATTAKGRKKLDSLTLQRPGLLDSLAKVELLYQQLNQ